jgi:hypothetical protein
MKVRCKRCGERWANVTGQVCRTCRRIIDAGADPGPLPTHPNPPPEEPLNDPVTMELLARLEAMRGEVGDGT